MVGWEPAGCVAFLLTDTDRTCTWIELSDAGAVRVSLCGLFFEADLERCERIGQKG